MAVALEGTDCVDALVWTAVIQRSTLIHVPAQLPVVQQLESGVTRAHRLSILVPALVLTSAVAVLAWIRALARPIVQMQTVALPTITVERAQSIHAEMRTPTVCVLAFIHVLAGFMVIPVQDVSRRTATPETAFKVLTGMGAPSVLRETLVNVQARHSVLRQLQTKGTRAVEATHGIHTVVGARLHLRCTFVNVDTCEVVHRRQFMALGTETLKASEQIHTLVTATAARSIGHTFVNVLAGQVVAAQVESFGTAAGEGSVRVMTVVRAVVQVLRALVNVLAVELILG